MIYAIGIDPAATTGIAALADGRIAWSSTLKRVGQTDPFVRRVAIAEAVGAMGAEPSQVSAVVESQYSGPSPKSTIAIVRHCAAWEAIMISEGIAVSPAVLPSQWRKTFGLGARAIKNKKAAAVEMVRSAYGVGVGADEAEAILIAAHLTLCVCGDDIPPALAWARNGVEK